MITNFIVAGTKSDLNDITFNDRLVVALLGNNTVGDSFPKIYIFNSSSSSTADGTNIIRPNMYANSNGRLILKTWDDASNSAINSTSVGLSKAQLNSQYPNAQPRFQVFCPSILLGGAIYVKGTGNNWQTISAPPTL